MLLSKVTDSETQPSHHVSETNVNKRVNYLEQLWTTRAELWRGSEEEYREERRRKAERRRKRSSVRTEGALRRVASSRAF